MSEPTWYWSEITVEVVKELLYYPVKYREPDDILDRRANHFQIGTVIFHNETEETFTIVQQWDSGDGIYGSSGGTYGYGKKKYNHRTLASIGKAWLGRRVKK